MAKEQDPQKERGRQAERPREIPKPGWRDILVRVKRQMGDDNISIVAAGVAFYGLLAIIPGLAALVSTYGLVANPSDVRHLVTNLQGTIPEEARSLLEQQLASLVQRSGTALSLGAVLGILLALWSASKGTKALIQALNIVYHEEERRGFLRLNLTAVVLTLGAVIGTLVGLTMVVIMPAVLNFVGLGSATHLIISLVRWPVLLGGLLGALAILYRFAPSRERPQWRWVTWGSVIASVLWIVASVLFSLYVSKFGSYNKTYGSLGAVVILLLWFYLTAYIILFGAELNAEMEHQTEVDTTVRAPRPMGERGAHVADTVGETP